MAKEVTVITQDLVPLPSAEIALFVGIVNFPPKYRDQVFELSPILDSTGSRLLHYQLPTGDYVPPSAVRPLQSSNTQETAALKEAAKKAAAQRGTQTPQG